MRSVSASVPGKLILIGEHAVVYGHPAVVGAVDRRLTVTATELDTPEVLLELPQVHETVPTSWAAIEAVTNEAHRVWRRFLTGRGPARVDHRPSRLVELAVGTALRALGAHPSSGLRLCVDSELPIGSGFGSSAAVAVAVPAAVLRLFDDAPPSPATLGRLALDVERFQHGLPSGIDTRAVLQGGLIWARPDHASGELHTEDLPADAPWLRHLRVYHSGTPAESTGEVVTGVRHQMSERPKRVEATMATIERLTEAVRHEVESPTVDSLRHVVELFRQGEAALEELGVVPEPTRAVIREIEARGGAAKISGAGALSGRGAGCVIVVHEDPEEIDEWSCLDGWRRWPIGLPTTGLRHEEAAS